MEVLPGILASELYFQNHYHQPHTGGNCSLSQCREHPYLVSGLYRLDTFLIALSPNSA